jgi:hypothetical protein
MRPAYAPPVKQQILARVAAGETVKAICRGDAALPCAESVSIWARRDPAFGSALAAARRRADWMRRFAFDEAVAAAFLARVAAGERIKAVVGTPGMPGAATYRYWRRTQIGFQEALWRVRGARYERLGAHNRGLARWPRFDPAAADRILLRVARGERWAQMLAADPSLPGRQAATRWRREQPDWDQAMRIAFEVGRRARPPVRCTPELIEAVGDRIVCGASLRSLGAEPDMPCAETFYHWVARWPAFAAEVSRACEIREWWYLDQMLAISDRHGLFGLKATKREAAPLQRQLNALAKRPGWKRARDAERDGG